MSDLPNVSVDLRGMPGFTMGQLASAFAEWHRRWVDEPARFASESAMLATPGQTYGESCAAYLAKILNEQRAA